MKNLIIGLGIGYFIGEITTRKKCVKSAEEIMKIIEFSKPQAILSTENFKKNKKKCNSKPQAILSTENFKKNKKKCNCNPMYGISGPPKPCAEPGCIYNTMEYEAKREEVKKQNTSFFGIFD